MGEQQNEIGGQFAVHSLQVTITKAKWDDLRQFYLKLQARSPYIGIERFALNADRANPALLSASLRVSSVEISK